MPAIPTTPLVPVSVPSIYANKPLPRRMAFCTPDTQVGLAGIVADLSGLGFQLRLSDMFRSHAMQKQANLDFVKGRKRAFSPPPGSSMHEAGRAIDIDLSSMGVPLAQFWEIARGHGFFPIVDKPLTSLSESWHFDCRGSHAAVYDYVKTGKAGTSIPPYTQMAQSSINAIGVPLDTIPSQEITFLQSSLIRLGFDPGRIDGLMGQRTGDALKDAGADPDDPVPALTRLLQAKFPAEYPTSS